jgi:hypothetical protein
MRFLTLTFFDLLSLYSSGVLCQDAAQKEIQEILLIHPAKYHLPPMPIRKTEGKK